MAKQYTYIRIYKTTKDRLDSRAKQVNEDLKVLGINKNIPKIRFIDEVAKRLTYISNKDLIKMTAKRRNMKC